MIPIMERRGAACSPREFHDAVNVTFHNFESEVYDHEHRDMWESLPQQFELLIADCLQFLPEDKRNLRLLDIGCGTGLAVESILRSAMGGRIQSVDLLDSSPVMLLRARERVSRRKLPVSCHQGYLDSLSGDRRFDVIVTSSVLHHVPDLPSFLRNVRALQSHGGLFLHIQDPNGDYLDDPELHGRMEEQSRRPLPPWAYRLTPSRVARGLFDRATGRRGPAFIWKTNRVLLDKGIVKTPLSIHEIYSITDIHATLGDNEGISISRMRQWLPDYDCVSERAYAFFGELRSKLPAARRKIEGQLIAARALNGFHIGAAWRLRSEPQG